VTWEVLQGDCLQIMRDFAPGSFDAVISLDYRVNPARLWYA
jgi:predicted methyltransferase